MSLKSSDRGGQIEECDRRISLMGGDRRRQIQESDRSIRRIGDFWGELK